MMKYFVQYKLKTNETFLNQYKIKGNIYKSFVFIFPKICIALIFKSTQI